jgi:hypothetical protein
LQVVSNLSAQAVMEYQLPSISEQRIAALQSIEELNGLTSEELRWIADVCTERSVQDGELIFTQEHPEFEHGDLVFTYVCNTFAV